MTSLRTFIKNLIEEHKIEEVIFEDIQLQSPSKTDCAWGATFTGNEVGLKTYKILAEVIGMLVELFNEIDIPSSCVAPVVWKSKVKIKGKARAEQKKNTVAFALQHYQLQQVSEDEADAIGIGTYKTLV